MALGAQLEEICYLLKWDRVYSGNQFKSRPDRGPFIAERSRDYAFWWVSCTDVCNDERESCIKQVNLSKAALDECF